MKTKEQAAQHYLKNTVGTISEHASKCVIVDYMAGFEEAQRWIPISDEMPEDTDNIVESGKYSYTELPVITLTCNGKHSISKRTRYDKSEWKWSGSSSFSESVISWRPIQRT